MKLQIHSIHFDADRKLISFIEKKIGKLEKNHPKIIDCEIFLRLNNNPAENKTVEIKVNIPGAQFFAKERSFTFENGYDLALEALRSQLKKYREKQVAH